MFSHTLLPYETKNSLIWKPAFTHIINIKKWIKNQDHIVSDPCYRSDNMGRLMCKSDNIAFTHYGRTSVFSPQRKIHWVILIIQFVSPRGFQIYMWHFALTHVAEVMGAHSSKNNRTLIFFYFSSKTYNRYKRIVVLNEIFMHICRNLSMRNLKN